MEDGLRVVSQDYKMFKTGMFAGVGNNAIDGVVSFQWQNLYRHSRHLLLPVILL